MKFNLKHFVIIAAIACAPQISNAAAFPEIPETEKQLLTQLLTIVEQSGFTHDYAIGKIDLIKQSRMEALREHKQSPECIDGQITILLATRIKTFQDLKQELQRQAARIRSRAQELMDAGKKDDAFILIHAQKTLDGLISHDEIKDLLNEADKVIRVALGLPERRDGRRIIIIESGKGSPEAPVCPIQ